MDLDGALSAMDELRRRVDRWQEVLDERRTESGVLPEAWQGSWPRMEVKSSGTDVVLRAEVPGLTEKEIQVSVNQDVLTVSGERRAPVPEGYEPLRRERPDVRFTRSVALNCKCDMEKAKATVKDGILSVVLPKAPEAQPRQISVKAS
jgi:HSP20 family protein